jgi:membrane protease YdiL (CAAX protease family)
MEPTHQPPGPPAAPAWGETQPPAWGETQPVAPQPPAWGSAQPPAWGPSPISPPYSGQPLTQGANGTYATNVTNGTDPRTGKPFPGIGISVVWIAMYFALQAVCTVITMVIAILVDPKLRDKFTSGNTENLKDTMLNNTSMSLLGGLLLAGFITIVIVGLHLRKDQRHRIIGVFARNQWSTGLTIATAIGLTVAAGGLGALYSTFIVKGKEMQADTNKIVDAVPRNPLSLIVAFLAIAVVGPIVEELLFRGYLQSALARRMKPWMAITVASAVFGAIHFQPLAFPLLAGLGAVSGYLYHRTKSLKVPMIMHIANNSFAVIGLFMKAKTGA